MPPEQLHGKEADAGSDLLAFDCVPYEMLSGKRALDESSGAIAIAAIVEPEPDHTGWHISRTRRVATRSMRFPARATPERQAAAATG